MPPALAGGFLTTVLPGKSPRQFQTCKKVERILWGTPGTHHPASIIIDILLISFHVFPPPPTPYSREVEYCVKANLRHHVILLVNSMHNSNWMTLSFSFSLPSFLPPSLSLPSFLPSFLSLSLSFFLPPSLSLFLSPFLPLFPSFLLSFFLSLSSLSIFLPSFLPFFLSFFLPFFFCSLSCDLMTIYSVMFGFLFLLYLCIY